MTENRNVKIGGLLLAAGGSSRLGQPKQLLQFNGKTLLRHAAEAMAASICDPIVVVLGAETARSTAEIEGLSVFQCLNENWKSGMSSSIKVGLAQLVKIAPEIDAVLISLCDQPYVTAEMLNRFGEKFAASDASVVAAKYNGVAGVPALFSRELFGELSRLDGDKGARDLIRSRSDIETIDLPEAAFDIDTLDDASKLYS
ncbi:MAG: nucleotidyltransferase family protein [Pyrinomonadaceae bacterium]